MDKANDKGDQPQGSPDIRNNTFGSGPAQEEVHRPSTPERGPRLTEETTKSPELDEYVVTGPWFVLAPTGREMCQSDIGDSSKNGSQWSATRYDNAKDADAKAVELIRNGHPMVYIGRGLFEVTIPVQMTHLIERKPTP